ncbi:hypothetical protein K2Y11_22445 [bacterium]|nr:hypothetical protein [bacterium]
MVTSQPFRLCFSSTLFHEVYHACDLPRRRFCPYRSASSVVAKPPGKVVVVDPNQNTVAGVGAHGFVAVRVTTDSGIGNLDVKVDGESVKFVTTALVFAEPVNGKRVLGGDHLHVYLLPQKEGQSKVTLTPVDDEGKKIDRLKPMTVTINVKGDK